MINPAYYKKADLQVWNGRIDGNNPNQLRWHQSIKPIDLNKSINFIFQEENKREHVVLLGFACDEGVRRNKGRVGASEAPEQIRAACSNFPVHSKIQLHDAGDIICVNQNLEEAQEQLAIAVQRILEAGAFPILLGGGHEITFGHYSGIKRQFPSKTIGIINFDAHFDNRIPDKEGASSGTGFWQIAKEIEGNSSRLHYLAIGIQRSGNTKELFDRANETGSTYLLDKELNIFTNESVKETITNFCEEVDGIYLSIDMDVFSAAFAPGVSAANPKGLMPDYLFDEYISTIFKSKKVISVDFAEINPTYDLDNRTSKLAARLVFDVIERI